MKFKEMMLEFINPNAMNPNAIVNYFIQMNGNNYDKAYLSIQSWASRAKKSPNADKVKIEQVLKIIKSKTRKS